MNQHRGEAHVNLLKQKSVKRWFDNLSRGSVITADVYLRRLGKFCNDYDLTPTSFAKMKDREIQDLIFDMVTDMENDGKSGSYIESILKALRSWLVFQDHDIKFKVKIRDARDTPTLREERVPTFDELRKILLSASPSGRVIVAFMAFSGLRPQVLGSYMGDGGLTVGDLPEMKVKNGLVEFERMPAMIRVKREHSKAGHAYFTFLAEEGCEYLATYLEERMAKGEQLTKDSAIITPKSAKKPFVSTTNITDHVRKALRSAGFTWRPYVLRSYFATQIMLAESKGMVLRDYRTFWIGHKGDIEHTYTTSKSHLPIEVVEDMRDGYRKAQELLQTVAQPGPNEQEIQSEVQKQMLRMVGYRDIDIDNIDFGDIRDEDVKDLFRRVVNESSHVTAANGASNGINGNGIQRIVTIEEANDLMADGWEYVSELSNGRVVVKGPVGVR